MVTIVDLANGEGILVLLQPVMHLQVLCYLSRLKNEGAGRVCQQVGLYGHLYNPSKPKKVQLLKRLQKNFLKVKQIC